MWVLGSLKIMEIKSNCINILFVLQVSFNEAVNKVSSGKDSIILELREKDSSSTEKLRVAQGLFFTQD